MTENNLTERTKNCSECGKTFDCKPQNGCWCEELDIPLDNLKKLFLTFDNCLCKDCLIKYSSNKDL